MCVVVATSLYSYSFNYYGNLLCGGSGRPSYWQNVWWSMKHDVYCTPSPTPPTPLAFFASLTFSCLPQTFREDSDTSLVQTKHLFPQRIQGVSYFIKQGGGGGEGGRKGKQKQFHPWHTIPHACFNHPRSLFPFPRVVRWCTFTLLFDTSNGGFTFWLM